MKTGSQHGASISNVNLASDDAREAKPRINYGKRKI